MRQCNDADSNETKELIDGKDEYKYDNRFKCGLHPRNWCDSLETSKRCDSFENCLAKWSKTAIKYKSKEIDSAKSPEMVNSQKTCGFCIYVFNKLQQALQQNETEVEIRDYLEGACTLLPTEQLSQKVYYFGHY